MISFEIVLEELERLKEEYIDLRDHFETLAYDVEAHARRPQKFRSSRVAHCVWHIRSKNPLLGDRVYSLLMASDALPAETLEALAASRIRVAGLPPNTSKPKTKKYVPTNPFVRLWNICFKMCGGQTFPYERLPVKYIYSEI
jgi:hypothetical protein